MEMMPRYENGSYLLDPKLFSIAGGLAVLAGSTLILSSQDGPLSYDWNYKGDILPKLVYE
ncbi:unnamed protein product [Penicillium salamii]|nr:unnamed protein product [Penicillium salamii]CAG8288665.1 unnamed protein product [Penicillium salamii]